MTLEEVKTLIVSADPTAKHYYADTREAAYTVWREYSMLPDTADDVHVEGWRFQIDRYTTEEYDEVARRIRETLDACGAVSYQYLVDYEGTPTLGGLIHHIFDCMG